MAFFLIPAIFETPHNVLKLKFTIGKNHSYYKIYIQD